MKDEDVVHFFNATLSETRDYTDGLRQVWNKNLDKYLCIKDFGKKKDWQFKVYTPFAKPKSKRAASIITSILLKGDDIFDFETPKRSTLDPQYQRDLERCNYTKRLLKAHLGSKTCEFYEGFREIMEACFGFTGIMIGKMWVVEHDKISFDAVASKTVIDTQMGLKFKAIDPWNFDMTPDQSIQIEHQFVTLPELWDMVDQGAYEKKLVKEVLNCDYVDSHQIKQEAMDRMDKLGLNEAKNEYRKEVMLSHYWGPIISKKGRFKGQHKCFTIANEKHLLTEVNDNPNFDKSTPYIIYSPLKVPFRSHGKALTEDVNCIEDAIVDFVNLQLDNLLWRLLGMREMPKGMLDAKTKREVKEVYPGQVLLTPTGQNLQLNQVQVGFDPQQAIPILQELRTLHDQETGVTDFISAMPSSGDITAAEQTQKRTDALGMFESVAIGIEKGFLVKCYDKARDLVIQYMADPSMDPNAQQILGAEGKQLDMMLPEERKLMIVSEYNIVARGVSIFFEKLKKMNAYTGIYKILAQAPPDAIAWINWENFWKDVFDVLSLDNKGDKLKTAEQMKQEGEAKAAQQEKMLQLEIQKHLLPMQTKIKQTEMGIQERMTGESARLERDREKQVMQIQADMQKQITQLQAEMQKQMAQMQAENQKLMLTMDNAARERQMKFMLEGVKIATSE